MKNINNYHDWNIEGIIVNQDCDKCKLILELEGRKSQICFLNVVKMRVDNFMLGNIVLDITRYSGKEDAQYLTNNKSFNSLFYLPDEVENYERICSEIESFNLSYIEALPSYGCQIMIVCSDVQWRLI